MGVDESRLRFVCKPVDSIVCLLLTVIQAARPEAEIQIRPKTTCTGVCPVPSCIVTWTSVAPARLNISSLYYNVFCCGDQNKSYCYYPEKYEEELKALLCCRKPANQSGITLSCDVTGAMRDIYKPYSTPHPQLNLFTVFALTDGDNNTRLHFSELQHLSLHFGDIYCTEPSNFTAAVSSDNVRLSWGLPPRMCDTVYRFNLRYSLLPDGCSNDSTSIKSTPLLLRELRNRSKTSFHREVRVRHHLKPYREYLFSLTCDTLKNIESAAAVVRVRTLSRVPLVGPSNILQGNVRHFKTHKRNVTLTWKSPAASCPAKWNGRPVKFLLQYFPKSSSNASALNQESDVSKLSDVTTVDINPSSNSAVIGYLNRFQDYEVNLSMCTEAGCGPVTNTVIGAELPEPTRRTKIGTENGTSLWVVVTASVLPVLALAATAALFVILVKYFKSRRSSSELAESQAQHKLNMIVDGITPYVPPLPYSTLKPQTQDEGDYTECALWLLEESDSLGSSSGTQFRESETAVDTA